MRESAADHLPGPGHAALQLAMTLTPEEEQERIAHLQERGFRCAVTEVGGRSDVFQERLIQSVMGAALNRGVVVKEAGEVHALLHATIEAKHGCLVDTVTAANVAFKVAIVRSERWLAVAMFGYSGLHRITNHERAGLGIMHI